MAGGHDGCHYLSSVEVFNPVMERWTSLPNMTVPRSGFGLVWKREHQQRKPCVDHARIVTLDCLLVSFPC